MNLHQRLTVIGVILLVATILINYHQEDHPGVGFNYAYVTGIAMLAIFITSFFIFTKKNLKQN